MGFAVSAGLGIMGQVMNYNSQMDAANSKAQSALQAQNMKFQNYEIERQDAFDSTVNQLTSIKMQQQTQIGTAATVIGETMDSNSNTAKLLQRSVASQGAQAEGQVKASYSSKSNEIDLNKEATALSTTSYINSIKRPSSSALLVNIGSSIYGTMQQGYNAEADAETKGVSFDWGNYMWKGSGTKKYNKNTTAT